MVRKRWDRSVNGNTYTYYVTALNSAGESDKSNEVQATPASSIPEFSEMWITTMIITFIILGKILIFRKLGRTF